MDKQEMLQQAIDGVSEEYKSEQQEKFDKLLPAIEKFIDDHIDINDTFFMYSLANVLNNKVISSYKQKLQQSKDLLLKSKWKN